MSLITYPVATDPRAFTPRSVSLAQDVNARSFASPFGGSEQAVDMLNDRWRLSMELPPCTQPDAAKREAFINALRGQVNHTELHHFGRPYPQGTLASCQGLVYDAPQGADSITIATTAGATLLAGDMLGVGGLLLQCRADCAADANGLLVVPLTNRLRRAISGLRRASTATYVDGSGVLQNAGVDVPRFQGGQLLVEGQATNYALNNNNATPGKYTSDGADGTISVLSDPFWGLVLRITKTAGSLGARMGARWSVGAVPGSSYTGAIWIRRPSSVTSGRIHCDMSKSGGGLLTASRMLASIASGSFVRAAFSASEAGASLVSGIFYAWVEGPVGDYVDVALPCIWAGASDSSAIVTGASPVTRAADIITPVVWQKPTAPFRLVGRPALRYVPGYSESLALDFVEKVD